MLNIFNRVATIVGLLAVIAAAALATVLVFAPGPVRDQLALSMQNSFDLIGTMQPTQQMIVGVVSGVIILVAFVLLVIELRPGGDDDLLHVRGSDGGETTITRQAVVRRLEYAVKQLDDVLKADPTASGRAEGLTVHLNVTTSPYVDVPMKTEEIRAVTKDVVENQMGLGLKKVTVMVDHDTPRDEVAETVQ